MGKKSFSKGIDAIFGSDEDEIIEPSSKNTLLSKNDYHESAIRTTIYMETDIREQLKALAYWERRSFTSVIKEALHSYLEGKGKKYIDEVTKKFNESGN